MWHCHRTSVCFSTLDLPNFVFLRPALKYKEFRKVIGFLPFSIFLFLLGFIFGRQLSKQRPIVSLSSFIFAILLPADSILADFLFALPIIILFEQTCYLIIFPSEERFHN